jgi:hypothetical protein
VPEPEKARSRGKRSNDFRVSVRVREKRSCSRYKVPNFCSGLIAGFPATMARPTSRVRASSATAPHLPDVHVM